MKFKCKELEQGINFEPVKLEFQGSGYSNIFAKEINKTLRERVAHRKYSKFIPIVKKSYSQYLDWSLGKFLLTLKKNHDPFYLKFLNKYGDDIYCQFSFKDDHYLNKKGIYAFVILDEIKYVGMCRNKFKIRVNQGYGKISSRNCFIDGQATNCRVNALIEKHKDEVSFYVSVMQDDKVIERKEKQIIQVCSPQWNIAMKKRQDIV